jgi:hypothetical protein
VKAYSAWIERQRARIGTSEARLEGYEETAATHHDACESIFASLFGAACLCQLMRRGMANDRFPSAPIPRW